MSGSRDYGQYGRRNWDCPEWFKPWPKLSRAVIKQLVDDALKDSADGRNARYCLDSGMVRFWCDAGQIDHERMKEDILKEFERRHGK